MSYRPKIGDVIAVEFLDHVEDSDEPYTFRVFGRVCSKNKTALGVCSWEHADSKGKLRDDGNEKVWSIVKKAITNLEKLK